MKERPLAIPVLLKTTRAGTRQKAKAGGAGAVIQVQGSRRDFVPPRVVPGPRCADPPRLLVPPANTLPSSFSFKAGLVGLDLLSLAIKTCAAAPREIRGQRLLRLAGPAQQTPPNLGRGGTARTRAMGGGRCRPAHPPFRPVGRPGSTVAQQQDRTPSSGVRAGKPWCPGLRAAGPREPWSAPARHFRRVASGRLRGPPREARPAPRPGGRVERGGGTVAAPR